MPTVDLLLGTNRGKFQEERAKLLTACSLFAHCLLTVTLRCRKFVEDVINDLKKLLWAYETQYNNREIENIEHNYSSDASSV